MNKAINAKRISIMFLLIDIKRWFHEQGNKVTYYIPAILNASCPENTQVVQMRRKVTSGTGSNKLV